MGRSAGAMRGPRPRQPHGCCVRLACVLKGMRLAGGCRAALAAALWSVWHQLSPTQFPSLCCPCCLLCCWRVHMCAQPGIYYC